MPPPPLSRCVNGWRENCVGKLYLRMLTVALWMTSIPLMDGAGKRESERPLSCSQYLPSFFLVKDSSLAHDCLLWKTARDSHAAFSGYLSIFVPVYIREDKLSQRDWGSEREEKELEKEGRKSLLLLPPSSRFPRSRAYNRESKHRIYGKR